MYTRENYRLVKEEIEARRISSISEADMKNMELRSRSPEIKEIDEELW